VANRLAQELDASKCGFAPFWAVEMERRVNRFLLFLVPLMALLAGSCGRPAELSVRDVVVKLSPVDANPAALYFTVHGGEAPVELLRVSSSSVVRAEMHESKIDPKTGMMTMAPIDRIKIPAKSMVEFKRGGKHAMLYGVNRIARSLEKIDIEFLFNNGDRILVTAPVEKAASSEGEHKDH
jgi:periplasmic copper chaperone A